MSRSIFHRLIPVPKGWRVYCSERDTWCTQTTCSFAFVDRILYDPALIDRAESLVAEAIRPAPVADVAVDFGGLLRIVSRRVRSIIEEYGPGDCQFLPIDIQYDDVSLGLEYFVLKCLRVIDCADYEVSPERMLKRPVVYMRAKLQADRVPADIQMFQVKYSAPLALLVREPLRRALVKARLEGGGFHMVPVTRVMVRRPVGGIW